MSNRPNQFPLDLTGVSPRNLIQNEKRTTDSNDNRIFVPSGGVYFTESLIMYDDVSGRRLHPLVDFKCLHLHVDASYDSGKQCCCVIVLVNESVTSVRFDYQVVGGHYADNISAFRDLIAGVDFNTLTRVAWGTQVYNKPETFPAAAHKHPGSEFGDWKRFQIALNNIYHALLHKDHAAWEAVYGYIDSIIANLNLTNFNDNYYNKVEIDNKLDTFKANLVTDDELSRVRSELDDALNSLSLSISNITSSISDILEDIRQLKERKQIGVSPDRGNLIELRNNGIFYGIEAPADLTNLFVDAVAGNDGNSGSKSQPLKTLDKALRMSPRDNSNTIWLKCIPEEHERDVCYYISHRHNIGNGVTRSIRCYGDTWVDGEKFREMMEASNNNMNWWGIRQIRRPAVRLKWYDMKLGKTTYKACNAFWLDIGASLYIYSIEFFVDQLTETNFRHPYSETQAFAYGHGRCVMHSCGYFRIVQDEDCSQRPLEWFNKDAWYGGFLTWNNRNTTTVWSLNNVMVGYASGMDGETPIVGKPKYVSWCDPTTAPERSNNKHDHYDKSNSRRCFFLTHDSPRTRIDFAERYRVGDGYNTVEGVSSYPSNIHWLLCNTTGISVVQYRNGICLNIESNQKIFDENSTELVNNFIQVNKDLTTQETDLLTLIDPKHIGTNKLYLRLAPTIEDARLSIGARFYEDLDTPPAKKHGATLTIYNTNKTRTIILVNNSAGGYSKSIPPRSALSLIIRSGGVDTIGGLLE